MVLEQPAPVEISPLVDRDLPDPEPGLGQLRVRVRCCAVCRTDLHVVEGDLPFAKSSVIPGHQIVGVVDKVGPSCQHAQIGQRVGIRWLRHTCGNCGFCTRRQENLCDASRYTGYHDDGGYAQACVVPESFAYAIPEKFSDIAAAPLLCAGLIGYRAIQRANVPEQGRLLMVGFGSSAHIVIQLAVHHGYEVFVVAATRN